MALFGWWPQIGLLPINEIVPLVMVMIKVIVDNKILTQNHLISLVLLFD
jgi:hypothetical protein